MYERRLRNGEWLPIIGTNVVAWMKNNLPRKYERMMQGEVVDLAECGFGGAQYRVVNTPASE